MPAVGLMGLGGLCRGLGGQRPQPEGSETSGQLLQRIAVVQCQCLDVPGLEGRRAGQHGQLGQRSDGLFGGAEPGGEVEGRDLLGPAVGGAGRPGDRQGQPHRLGPVADMGVHQGGFERRPVLRQRIADPSALQGAHLYEGTYGLCVRARLGEDGGQLGQRPGGGREPVGGRVHGGGPAQFVDGRVPVPARAVQPDAQQRHAYSVPRIAFVPPLHAPEEGGGAATPAVWRAA